MNNITLNNQLTTSLNLLDELLNSKSKEELLQEILEFEDNNVNSPTLEQYLNYTRKNNEK